MVRLMMVSDDEDKCLIFIINKGQLRLCCPGVTGANTQFSCPWFTTQGNFVWGISQDAHAGLLLKNQSYAQTVRCRTLVYHSRHFLYDFSVTDHFVNM